MDLPGQPGKFYFYPMAQPLLTVDRITLEAGQRKIVDGLSFVLYPGEILALTGKSGSGKTSIALSILGLLPKGLSLTEGTFTWQEDHHSISSVTDPGSWSQLRVTKIGFVQQDIFGAFDPVLSMERQMLMLLMEKSTLPADQVLRELKAAMEEVKLHDIPRLLKSYPFQLSGGQLQRCMIALMLTLRPSLLILDEPTSAIDKINQREVLHMLSALRTKHQFAILCITHEDDVVHSLADREICLEDKRMDTSEIKSAKHPPKSPDQQVVLEGHQLSYTYHFGGLMHKKGSALGPFDFRLYSGNCIGIVGESGSGKSTLAQLLVGLIQPQHGEVRLHGRTIHFNRDADVKRLRAAVQLVMQDGRGSLHPYRTIEKTLEEVNSIQEKQSNFPTRTLSEVMEEVGLSAEMLLRRPGQLSGGECLRVSIARSLLVNPRVLICDESTSALDSETRDGIVSLLSGLIQTRDMALIIISHDISVIRKLSNEIMVMAEGQIVEQGDALQLLTYPTHYVSKHIFSPDATSVRNQRP
jgi:peptide/nickel transport system ATP-binding protein